MVEVKNYDNVSIIYFIFAMAACFLRCLQTLLNDFVVLVWKSW